MWPFTRRIRQQPYSIRGKLYHIAYDSWLRNLADGHTMIDLLDKPEIIKEFTTLRYPSRHHRKLLALYPISLDLDKQFNGLVILAVAIEFLSTISNWVLIDPRKALETFKLSL